MKVLVIYATRYGSTARSAELVARTLQGRPGIEAEVVEARRARHRKLESAQAYVLGSSIAMGRWKGSARRLLPRLAATGRPTALFITAAGTLTGKKPGDPEGTPVTSTLEERETDAVARYVDAVLPATGLKPVAVAVFGGRMAFFGKEVVSNWDGGRVSAWAERLPELLR